MQEVTKQQTAQWQKHDSKQVRAPYACMPPAKHKNSKEVVMKK
jgi:hypothetical protein